MKRLIIDIDDTISFNLDGDYSEARINNAILSKISYYKGLGFDIVLFSARNMRTYNGNIGKINANTLPVLINWLNKNNIPYDEIFLGKPWCGFEGFYVDDKAVRPAEFVKYSYEELLEIMERDTLEPNS